MTRFFASRIRSIFGVAATVAFFSAGFCLTGSADDGNKIGEEQAAALKALQGKWTWLAFECDGKQIPIIEGDYILIEGTNCVVRKMGIVRKGTLNVDPKAVPKRIDFMGNLFEPCIYRFDSFKLEICGPPFGNEIRPTIFESKNRRRIEIYMRSMQ